MHIAGWTQDTLRDLKRKRFSKKGKINYGKSEPNGHPDPKYAMDGYTRAGQHLRVVFTPTEKGLFSLDDIQTLKQKVYVQMKTVLIKYKACWVAQENTNPNS
jgi:hypothetical protein